MVLGKDLPCTPTPLLVPPPPSWYPHPPLGSPTPLLVAPPPSWYPHPPLGTPVLLPHELFHNTSDRQADNENSVNIQQSVILVLVVFHN